MPKHDVTVSLIGTDGNAYNLIGLTVKALRRAKVSNEDVKAFTDECLNSTSYDNLLQVIMKWVNVE